MVRAPLIEGMTTDTSAPTRSGHGDLPRARSPLGLQPDCITSGAPALARVAAETAEWLSQQVIQDCGTGALEIAQRLRMDARSYRETSATSSTASP